MARFIATRYSTGEVGLKVDRKFVGYIRVNDLTGDELKERIKYEYMLVGRVIPESEVNRLVRLIERE